ncbi:transmembrane emp24 domain-containing protein p24delta9-like [Bidens hawaiensis]|uniref:transmembrane emp24 domain-containing protein p24delta9-like n=1 Tax=Bidens hawaiensis TaxID=980011 RepID=UPI00404A4DFD
MEAGLIVFIVILPYLSAIAKSIRFNVESGVTKCITEDLRIKSMTVGEYWVVNPNEGQPLPEHHKIYVGVFHETERRLYEARGVESGQFGFEVALDGKHNACFATIPHEPAVNTSVDFNWRSAVAVQAWTKVAKKGSVDAMELELKKMEGTVNWIQEEMTYLRQRNQQMIKQNMTTDSIMGWSSLASLFLCLSVAGLQIWHLQSFFEKKKIL